MNKWWIIWMPVYLMLMQVLLGCGGDSASAVNSDADTDADSDTDTDTDTDTDSDADSDSDSDADADTDSDSDADTDSDSDADTDSDSDSGSDTIGVTDVEITLEENQDGFCAVEGAIESDHAGFLGDGYANTDNADGAGIEWRFYLAQNSSVDFSWRYAFDGDAQRDASLIVDGETVQANVSFAGTGGWDVWNTQTVSLSLDSGVHSIRLEASTALGLANIDQMIVAGPGVASANCSGDVDTDSIVDSDSEVIVDTGVDTGADTSVDTSGAITIWIAGDSTVANGNNCPIGWGQKVDGLFNDNVTTVNSAVGGRSIRSWMYSVQTTMGGDGECLLDNDASGNPILQDRWQDMLDNMSQGDYLLIQFGINDGASTCEKQRHVGTEQYEIELGYMAQEAKQRGTNPVFITPLSMIKCSGSTAVGSRGFIDATFAAGEQNDVPVIDLHDLSVNLYNELSFCPLPAGYSDINANTPGEVGAFFCDDHTHLDNPGADAIAAVVAEALVEQSIPLASWLK